MWLGKTEYTKGKSLEDIRNDGVVNVYADTVSIVFHMSVQFITCA